MINTLASIDHVFHWAQLAAVKSGAAQMFGVNLGSWLVRPSLRCSLDCVPSELRIQVDVTACIGLRHNATGRDAGLSVT